MAAAWKSFFLGGWTALTVTVTGRYQDGTKPARGVVYFHLAGYIDDVGAMVERVPVSHEAPLDYGGGFSIALPLLGTAAVYDVVESIHGAPPRRRRVTIPVDASHFDLSRDFLVASP